MSEEDRVVGIYSYDQVRSKLPEAPGMPEINRRLRQSTDLGKLKLLSDHTFVISGPETTEGKWSVKDSTITLVPEPGSTTKLLIGKQKEFKGEFTGSAIEFRQGTPFGEVVVNLRKTG